MNDDKFLQVVNKFLPDSKLLSAKPLIGGVSADVTLLDIQNDDGSREKLLVRKHGEHDLEWNPHVATNEFRLLEILKPAGLPVATPRFLDTSGEIFNTPYVVLEYLEGQTNFKPDNLDVFLRQMAETLAQIHRIDTGHYDLSFLRRQSDWHRTKLRMYAENADKTEDETRILEILQDGFPFDAVYRHVLLHNDFWCGNILWQGEKLAGVIDWEDASTGNPLSCLASARRELIWAFGMDTMHSFTAFYQTVVPDLNYDHLPYHDLMVALQPEEEFMAWAEGWDEYGRDDVTGATMLVGNRAFVAQAIAAI